MPVGDYAVGAGPLDSGLASGSRNRLGDYVGIDPVDQRLIWVVGECSTANRRRFALAVTDYRFP